MKQNCLVVESPNGIANGRCKSIRRTLRSNHVASEGHPRLRQIVGQLESGGIQLRLCPRVSKVFIQAELFHVADNPDDFKLLIDQIEIEVFADGIGSAEVLASEVFVNDANARAITLIMRR